MRTMVTWLPQTPDVTAKPTAFEIKSGDFRDCLLYQLTSKDR